ncbi:UPF0182 family protein [Amnibacterium sp. CER49]|uniref:UPF0182 family membrane protein n=1 Tax=Amnibacterium sp. CER49 TaxID=3039161 RepID=UPI002446A3CF|nr:UPF0182 family protein [Amnibacterium sp. CER49]MDH2445306.1 UPF0182 family protein [Amnibacterium sp. CER49]
MTTPAAAPARRRRAALAITLGVVVVLLIGFFLFAGLYTDVLWFTQLGYQTVLFTEWLTIASLFVVGFLGMAVPVFVSIQLAHRLRPVYAKLTAQLDRYQQVIEPLRRVVMFGVPAVVGLFAAVSAATRWQPVLLFLHGGATNTQDKQFGIDTGFYLFQLPALHGLAAFVSAVLVVSFLAAVATAYLYGGIRVTGRELRVSRAARAQIALTFALFLVVQAASLFLDQYTTLYDSSTGDLITGAAYADAHAVIPGRLILAVVALIVAGLFVFTAFAGRWRLPAIGIVLLVVSGVLVGSIFPWAMYNLYVHPNGASLEKTYLQHNIDATKAAYGVGGVQQIPYNATTSAQPGALRSDAETTASIRIIDPNVVSPTFGQFQQFKQYYQFPADLDVDRYTIGGKSQDAVVAVRELNLDGLGSGSTAFNDAFVYTHGYGFVGAYGNKRSADGTPQFFESNIPTTGALGSFEPRVYFGESEPPYSIVGAPKGTKPIEIDYATGSGAGGSQASTTFTGSGGPSVGSFFNRLLYALKFQSDQILLSTNGLNAKSQILYDRDPLTRVQKVAPYLTLDRNPYPAVVGRKLVWIVDGYTTSSYYPYSQQESLSAALSNSADSETPYATDQVNYIRNSVKATVDAYTGKVTLYAWDTQDPVLQAWQNVFPSTVQPLSQMSGALMAHVRYPEDLFQVQRFILGRYHVTDPTALYQSDDAWRVPAEPTQSTSTFLQPPYYLTMQMPGQSSPAFTLYSTYIPAQNTANAKGNLTGYLGVDADAGTAGGTKRPDYGRLRLLVLPRNGATVNGPGVEQNQFNANTTVSTTLNLLKQGGSRVDLGNLLTLPVGGGLLYVQPVYVKSSSETSYPVLQKVIAGFGSKVAFADTLDEALNTLFGGNSGASAGDTNVSGGGGSSSSGSGSGSSSTGSKGTPAAVKQALADAAKALQDRQNAYAKNDLVGAAQADQRLQQDLQRAIQAGG